MVRVLDLVTGWESSSGDLNNPPVCNPPRAVLKRGRELEGWEIWGTSMCALTIFGFGVDLPYLPYCTLVLGQLHFGLSEFFQESSVEREVAVLHVAIEGHLRFLHDQGKIEIDLLGGQLNLNKNGIWNLLDWVVRMGSPEAQAALLAEVPQVQEEDHKILVKFLKPVQSEKRLIWFSFVSSTAVAAALLLVRPKRLFSGLLVYGVTAALQFPVAKWRSHRLHCVEGAIEQERQRILGSNKHVLLSQAISNSFTLPNINGSFQLPNLK